MAFFTTALGLNGGVLWSGELQGLIVHEMVPVISYGLWRRDTDLEGIGRYMGYGLWVSAAICYGLWAIQLRASALCARGPSRPWPGPGARRLNWSEAFSRS
jgi:hypothetical protein